VSTTITAVLWDFGGVILESPFEAFARYERRRGLPDGFIRRLNAANPDTNAWARLERGEVGLAEFGRLFETEAANAGERIVAAEVLALLSGAVRPPMVEAVRRCAARLKTALLTNNFVGFEGTLAAPDRPTEIEEVIALFGTVIESSKVGVRKPDPRIYELACALLDIQPSQAVFLDDLGVNLKPARAMGMTTIKVTDPDVALEELESVVGFPMR
jgi:putative hydrolase of the HAD superfamily